MSKNYNKILVELHEGSFLDLFCEQQYIMSGKPQVAKASSAISNLIARGKAKLVAELSDNATQEAFDKVWNVNKGDSKKAVEAFLKDYSRDKKVQPAQNNGGQRTQGSGSNN